MKAWKAFSTAVAVMAITGVSYIPFTSAEEGKDIEQMVATAKTPADHEAIAAYYEKEAQDAHKKHAQHQKMEESYKKNPALNKSNFGWHCDQVAQNYEKIAKQYDDLAKMHKEMAQAVAK
jgi:hypothetical protein